MNNLITAIVFYEGYNIYSTLFPKYVVLVCCGKPYFGTKDPTGKIQKALEKTDYRKQIISNFTLLYSINEFLGAQNFFQPDSWGTLRTIKHF